MRAVGLFGLTLALGAGCTQTHRHTDEAILAGPVSQIVVRCASAEECTHDPTAKHDEVLCRTTSYRCRVDEVGAARTTPLVPEVETELVPLALDPVRSIAWLAWAGATSHIVA